MPLRFPSALRGFFARASVKLGIEPVGPAGTGVGQDGLQAMVVMEPLKEQILQSDPGGKEALIEAEVPQDR